MRYGVIAALLVVAIVAGAGVGYLVANENERTATATSTLTQVSTTTVTIVTTSAGVSQYENASFIYLTSNGLCTAGGEYMPCFGSPAYVFNTCPNLLSGPPAPYTCTYTVQSVIPPYPSYTFNITLGVTGQASEPEWANCALPAVTSTSYADCIPIINSTAFIVGVPAPPVP